MQDDDFSTSPQSPGLVLLPLAIGVPTLLGVYPVRLALVGMGFGPAIWVACAWQLASAVTWVTIAAVALPLLRRRTDANVAIGRPSLVLIHDGASLWPGMLAAALIHAATIACASVLLMLGRGRPPFPVLLIDVFLLYAPMNAMTMIGLVAAAIVAAEYRARVGETTIRARLERELGEARNQVVAALAGLNGSQPNGNADVAADHLDRIMVTSGNRTTIVPVDDVDWIEAKSYYARLHVGASEHLVRQSMNALESQLDPKRFARIHRSTIVNLERVVDIRPFDRRSFVVTLRGGRQLMMSRRRRQLLDYLLP